MNDSLDKGAFVLSIDTELAWGGVYNGSFRNRAAEDIFDGRDTRAARSVCPQILWPIARRKLDQINRVRELRALAVPPGNRLQRLRGARAGQHSVRINDQ